MDLYVDIASLTALIVFIILAIYAISSLSKVNSLLVDLKPKIEKSLDGLEELKDKSIESMTNADETSKNFASLAKTVENQVEEIEGIIKPYKQLANDVYSKVYRPINNSAVIVSAINKAVSTFTERLRR